MGKSPSKSSRLRKESLPHGTDKVCFSDKKIVQTLTYTTQIKNAMSSKKHLFLL